MLWVDKANLVSDPEHAWFEMFATARDQAMLKQQAGQDARGRKNTKPVLHYTLSWAASDNPSPEHMRETALSSLKALKLDQHQALMAAHCDKDHMHVHIVVNTIHPETGMTAPLKYTKEALSKWAEAYEREHGIHVEQRIKNNEERDRIKAQKRASEILMARDQRDCARGKMPYVPVKHRSPNRQQWLDRKDILNRMKQLRSSLDDAHKGERDRTWQRHVYHRELLDYETKVEVDRRRGAIRDSYKILWRHLYRNQRREMRHVEKTTTHPLERAVFVYKERERLGHGKPLTLRQMLPLVRSQSKLIKRLDAVHEKERRSLARVEKSEKRAASDRIWEAHKVRFGQLKDQQSAERQALRDQQFAKRCSITFAEAKSSLIEERSPPANQNAKPALHRADDIKRRMEEWRKQNPGRDFGREM